MINLCFETKSLNTPMSHSKILHNVLNTKCLDCIFPSLEKKRSVPRSRVPLYGFLDAYFHPGGDATASRKRQHSGLTADILHKTIHLQFCSWMIGIERMGKGRKKVSCSYFLKFVFPEKILVSLLFLRKNLEKKKITFLTLEIYIYYIPLTFYKCSKLFNTNRHQKM